MGSILGWLLAAAASVGGGLVIIPNRRRLGHRVVERLDHSVRRKVSRFDRRYREFVLGSLRFVDLKGLATVGFYTPELDDVFVDVSLAYRAPHLITDDIVDPPTVSGDRTSLIDMLDRPEPVVLAVIGVPGSGKSTLLRHTARVVCQNRRKRRRTLPILLYLRDHVAAIVSTPDLTLPALVRAMLGRYTESEPPGWLDERLRDGDCVVLLDGLDEVAEQADRRRVANWVELQTKQYPKNDYVITSRPQGYRTAGIDGAVVLQVRGFSDKQVSHFVRAWYFAVERHGGAVGEDVRTRAEAAAADLLRRLNGAPALYDLTVNPLLLTMIANVHRYRGALPGGRVDLYREICEVVLWRRKEAKNLTGPLTGDKREALLRGLAFAMMKARVRDLPRAKVLSQIRPALRRMTQEVTAEDFLADESRDGLFVERENGEYSFAHHTFQEYLAAAHIRDKGHAKLLCDSVDDLWWREATLLYTARSDADAIIRACLNSDSPTALSLAFDCADQCRELAPGLRKELDGLLESALGPDASPERRRLMISVQLTRHLAQLVRTTGDTRVCVNPITAGIYRLYLQDIDADSAQPPANQVKPEDPVTGVSAADAADFLRWVNSTIGQAGYRLPSRAEVSDSAVQRTLGTSTRSVWLQPAGEAGRSSLWTPSGQPHPHLIEPGTLVGHVAKDFHHVTPTLARILLLRSIATAQHIAVDPDHGLSRANAVAYELGIAHQLTGWTNMYHDFAGAEALAGDLTHNLGRDHALARASARDLEATLRRIAALDWTQAHSRPLDWVLGLDDSHDFAPAGALAAAMDRVLEAKPRSTDWLAALANTFSEQAQLFRTEYLVAPETLPNLVDTACERFKNVSFPGGPEFQQWCREVTGRYGPTATIPTVQQPLTVGRAAAIRLGALCFAAAGSDHEGLDEMFRQIAAGITLLERRATGLAAATETILLATA
jgi:hypothetical protein